MILNVGAGGSDWNPALNKLGAKNLLQNTATSRTVNGITFTVNEDKSITVNGTATELSHCSIYYGNEIPKGRYILSQGAEITQGVGIVIDALKSLTEGARRLATFYNGNIAEFENDYSDYNYLNVFIVIDKGVSVSKTFYPMIRYASISDDTYEPYAMTNKELTESLGEDENGMTVHEKLDYIMQNASVKFEKIYSGNVISSLDVKALKPDKYAEYTTANFLFVPIKIQGGISCNTGVNRTVYATPVINYYNGTLNITGYNASEESKGAWIVSCSVTECDIYLIP